MKLKIFAAVVAAVFTALCLPLVSACSAEAGYKLAVDENGEKYYVAGLSGFSMGLDGELEIPAYYGEGENYAPVREIADQAFSTTRISKVTIPATIEKIGTAAFSNIRTLTEVVFEEGSQLESISWGCFSYSNLEKINLPDSLKKIEGMAFFSCYALEELTLPEGLEEIGFRAFEQCEMLAKINFPSTLKTIGALGFYYTGLDEVILPDGMTSVGYAAFHSCVNLKLAVVGEGIESVEEGTFGYCISLEKIYLPSTIKSVKGPYYSEDGSLMCGHAFHHDAELKEVYFAGTEAEWEAVEIDREAVISGNETFDNTPLTRITPSFGVKYK